MSGQLWAFLALIFIAVSSVAIKRGIQDTSLYAGLIVSLGAGSLVTFPSAFTGIGQPDLQALLFFASAGVTGSLVGRGASIAGIDRLGASVAVSMEGTLYPLAAVVGGVVLLQAAMNVTRLVGVTAIVVGIWLLSMSHRRSVLDLSLSPSDGSYPRQSFVMKGTFPLIAGLSFAASDLLRDKAVMTWSQPVFGTFLGMFTALVVALILLVFRQQSRSQLIFGRGFPWFAVQGVATAAATVCAIKALSEVDVSIVSPILAAQPLPVLLLSLVLLKGLENVNRFTVAGALAVLLGTVLVAA